MIANERNKILSKLRPPTVQPTRVAYSFSRTPPFNYGLTLAVSVGQPLVAAGDGVIDRIGYLGALWRNDAGVAHGVAVRIDHGNGIKTWVHGFAEVSANYGAVRRGQLLGYAAQTQVFFGIEFNGVLTDPTHINQHFGLMDGYLGFQKAGNLHQAPDLITTVTSFIQSVIAQGIRYFIVPDRVPIRFGVDFNGHGNKSGPAVIGAPGDVWNPVAAINFVPAVIGAGYTRCVGGILYPAPPGFFLLDWRGAPTKVWFERSNMTAAAGDALFFDPMLSSWVGGYVIATPLLNSFTIRNIPDGIYDLYLYANGGASNDISTFYVSIGQGSPVIKTTSPTVTAAWVEDENYVKYGGLIVPGGSSITVLAYGYLAGLQLERQNATTSPLYIGGDPVVTEDDPIIISI